jgi:hypothetical protein
MIRIFLVLLYMCMISLLLACSDEDASNSSHGNSGVSGGSPGSGSATLTIGDESWSFDDVRCGFSQEETYLPMQSFVLSAFGETATGIRIELSAVILDDQRAGRYEGKGVSYAVSLFDAVDDENPALNWASLTGLFWEVEPVIKVDGKNVMANTTFQDNVTLSGDKIPGTLQATCP